MIIYQIIFPVLSTSRPHAAIISRPPLLLALRSDDISTQQGLKGDATYLIVKEDKTIENYGLNAVCTHLGCVVPWNKAENKFMCPCHGSQYDKTGTY